PATNSCDQSPTGGGSDGTPSGGSDGGGGSGNASGGTDSGAVGGSGVGGAGGGGGTEGSAGSNAGGGTEGSAGSSAGGGGSVGPTWASVVVGFPNDLHGVWGSGANDAWAVGDVGEIIHWNGSAWTADVVDSAATRNLNAVWGSSAGDVWAVGAGGTIVRWTGGGDGGGAPGAPGFRLRWAGVSSGTTNDLLGVWGSGASDVWAVGDAGTILHFDG